MKTCPRCQQAEWNAHAAEAKHGLSESLWSFRRGRLLEAAGRLERAQGSIAKLEKLLARESQS